MSRLFILTIISVSLATLIFFMKRKQLTITEGKGLVVNKEWLKVNETPITPESERRPADQTFLTFPEWFLVFSPAEMAQSFPTKTSTSFPFMSHVSQVWGSYGVMKDQIKGNFPPNTGYHFMIWVIAGSTTVEYGMKSLYENLIGRLTDTKTVITHEDKFNAEFAYDYVTFINERPWYEFDFKSQLKKLWSLPKTGPKFFRKWERRFCLTSELLVKWGYGKLIGMGTQTVYEVALPTTACIVDRVPENFPKEKVLKVYEDSSVLIQLPRYDRFKDESMQIALQGIEFKEIAGNTSAILLSTLMESTNELSMENAQIIFTQLITSNSTQKRVALVTPVTQLSSVLRQLKSKNITIEHVFDY